jgi:hypothetical protein
VSLILREDGDTRNSNHHPNRAQPAPPPKANSPDRQPMA